MTLENRKTLFKRLQKAQSVVDEQANDEALWCEYERISEAYLQQELRRLHAAIEGKSPDECARQALAEPNPATGEAGKVAEAERRVVEAAMYWYERDKRFPYGAIWSACHALAAARKEPSDV